MRKLFVFLLILVSLPAWADCSLTQKTSLATAGYSKDEIERMCSATSPAAQNAVQETSKSSQEASSKSNKGVRVYFINPEGGFNDALIMFGEKVLARTNKGMYHFTEVQPGRHTFYVTTWSKIFKSSIDIDTSSGEDVYLIVKANTGAGLVGVLAGPFVAGATNGGPYLFESTTTENGKKLLSSEMEFVEEK